MRRSNFLSGALAAAGAFALPRPAFASGGLDLDRPQQNVDIRVFLRSESARRYRGQLHSIALDDGRNGTLNTLSLEEYLYGVVPVEMPSSWPYAALEAQAILARTFAMKRRNPGRAYDVVAGSADQEYGGFTAEANASNTAIDACAGVVVTYNGAPANIAYMSCCGGHTDDAGRVWGTSYPYLGGVECAYCVSSPSRNWTVKLPWATIARAAGLRSDAHPAALTLTDLGPGGRPGALRIVTNAGEGTITTTRLREVSGYRLPSTFLHAVAVEENGMLTEHSAPSGTKASVSDPRSFDVESAPREQSAAPRAPRETAPRLQPSGRGHAADDDISLDADGNVIRPAQVVPAYTARQMPSTHDNDDGDSESSGNITLVFRGSGSGHGIGLCQWGARGMALAGATGQEIVAHYLPQTGWGAADDLVRAV